MRGYVVILRREVFTLFLSPATYLAGFYFLALLGIGFRFFLDNFLRTNWILPPLSSLATALVFGSPALVPFLTMRSLAEERRLGTLETLLATPVSPVAVTVGKWTASYLFFLFLCLAAFGYPLLTTWLYPEETAGLRLLEPAQVIGCALYLGATGAAFTAIGIFSSAVTRNQMVAGMLAFTLITLHLSVMTFFHGSTPSSDADTFLSAFLREATGSLTSGLDELEHFVLGAPELKTLLQFLVTTTLFLGLATLATGRSAK